MTSYKFRFDSAHILKRKHVKTKTKLKCDYPTLFREKSNHIYQSVGFTRKSALLLRGATLSLLG